MSASEVTPFTAWVQEPGLYSIHNTDTQEVLDQEERTGTDDLIHCWTVEPAHPISNPNQLWQLVRIKDDEWLLINKRAGTYAAAPDADCSVVPQSGHMDWTNTHWKIEPARGDTSMEVVFMSAHHPGSCLELVDGIVKVGQRKDESRGQTWTLKKHD